MSMKELLRQWCTDPEWDNRILKAFEEAGRKAGERMNAHVNEAFMGAMNRVPTSVSVTLAQLEEIVKTMPRPHKREKVYCNPANIEWLRHQLDNHDNGRMATYPLDFAYDVNKGIEIIPMESMPVMAPAGRADFPRDPFVEYEESDEQWALALGIAKPHMERFFAALPEVGFMDMEVAFVEPLERIFYKPLVSQWTS